MTVVEQILIAKRGCDRQIVGFDEALEVVARCWCPAEATDYDDRTLCTAKQATQRRDLHVGGRSLHRLMAQRVSGIRRLQLHVFRQRKHDRTRTAAGRNLKSARDE